MKRISAQSRQCAICLFILLLSGFASRPLLRGVASEYASPEPGLAQFGPSLSIAVLGGLRQVLANYLWLSSYTGWEKRDLEDTFASLVLAVSVDPKEAFFWKNGARMIAYDFPQWELTKLTVSSVDDEKRLREFYAERALDWLHAAEEVFPDAYWVSLEKGMISLHVLRDRRRAAEAFKSAWEKEDAPLYTARIYGELMRQEGERALAYEWYSKLLRSLPTEVQSNQKAILLPRIRSLEEVLGIQLEERFEL